MEIAARRATPDDVDELGRLVAQAVAEQADDRGGPVWSVREARPLPAEPSLRAAIEDPDRIVLAGTIDDVVVGYGVSSTERLRDDSLLGIVEDIYVDAGGREVGIGEAILDELVAWCAARGCRGVDALVLPGNRQSKNFFETFGFTARAIVSHRKLV